MDPCYQKPPQYAEINYHRVSTQTAVEVNEIGPTIQQGVIQCPVQRHTQAAGERTRGATVPVNVQQTTSVPSLQINGNSGTYEKEERDPEENGYVINCIHENRPFTVNDVGRPVFVNHYYAGEAFIPVTNKKLIKLDKCDVLTEISLKTGKAEREQVKRHGNAVVHSELREDSQNSLRMTSVSKILKLYRRQVTQIEVSMASSQNIPNNR